MTLPGRVSDLAPFDLLVDVVRLGSLSQAAAARGITQPSASTAIGRLERKLGMPLLRRGPTGSRPTDEGRQVAAWAQQAIDAAAAFDQELEALRDRRARRLRIVASFTVAEYQLGAWLRGLQASAHVPEVQLGVHNSAGVEGEIRSGAADVGFVEGATGPHGLQTRVVGGDRLVLVVDPRHRWARRSRPVPAGELAATPLVMREQGSGTREVVEAGLAPFREHAPQPLIELGSTTTVKRAVMDGVGPALLSELAVVAEVEAGTLRTVEVAGVAFERSFRAVWRPRERLHPAAARLLEIATA